jgi:hypothetical protein
MRLPADCDYPTVIRKKPALQFSRVAFCILYSAFCVALRHPIIYILPPCGMMSLKDLKEHH